MAQLILFYTFNWQILCDLLWPTNSPCFLCKLFCNPAQHLLLMLCLTSSMSYLLSMIPVLFCTHGGIFAASLPALGFPPGTWKGGDNQVSLTVMLPTKINFVCFPVCLYTHPVPDINRLSWLIKIKWTSFVNICASLNGSLSWFFIFFYSKVFYLYSPLRAGSGIVHLVTGWEKISLPLMRRGRPVRTMELLLLPLPIGAYKTHTHFLMLIKRCHILFSVSTAFHLVIFNLLRFEQAFANSLVFGRSGDSFWIGLYDKGSPGSFHWLSGDEVSYTNWNRDQPGRSHMSVWMVCTMKIRSQNVLQDAERQNQSAVVNSSKNQPARVWSDLNLMCQIVWVFYGNLKCFYIIVASQSLDSKQRRIPLENYSIMDFDSLYQSFPKQNRKWKNRCQHLGFWVTDRYELSSTLEMQCVALGIRTFRTTSHFLCRSIFTEKPQCKIWHS